MPEAHEASLVFLQEISWEDYSLEPMHLYDHDHFGEVVDDLEVDDDHSAEDFHDEVEAQVVVEQGINLLYLRYIICEITPKKKDLREYLARI
jgi:hypothetical protein